MSDSLASLSANCFTTTSKRSPLILLCSVETSLGEAKAKENSWVKHSLTLVEKEELARDNTIAWSACNALLQALSEDPPALCALLPLFYEKAATPAMVKHGMDVRQAIEYLNPGQIPVTTFDQPLFAISMSSGNCQKPMVNRCMLSCWVGCTPKWPPGVLLGTSWKILDGLQH